MILVDTSVWVGYFRQGENAEVLEALLKLDLVCTNEIVLTELIPALKHTNKHQVLEGLLALPCLPYTVFWEGIRALQLLNLQNGINKVGIPDLMIAQHCINDGIELWSLDKHFRLMATHVLLKTFATHS